MVYVDRLLQLFRYVPREQLTIPDFVFQLSSHALGPFSNPLFCFRQIIYQHQHSLIFLELNDYNIR